MDEKLNMCFDFKYSRADTTQILRQNYKQLFLDFFETTYVSQRNYLEIIVWSRIVFIG